MGRMYQHLAKEDGSHAILDPEGNLIATGVYISDAVQAVHVLNYEARGEVFTMHSCDKPEGTFMILDRDDDPFVHVTDFAGAKALVEHLIGV